MRTDAARQKCPAAFFRSRTGSHLQNSMQRGILKTTEKDIMDKLDSVPNKAGYIKALIRKDIEENG